MRFAFAVMMVSPALLVGACSASPEETTDKQATAKNQAEDFAARINDAKSQQAAAPTNVAPQAAVTPALAPAAAPAPALPVAPAPIAPECKSDRMREFLGRPANDATRNEIIDASEDVSEVRFVAPGSEYIRPDPTHPRLNIMIDQGGIIRDARCG